MIARRYKGTLFAAGLLLGAAVGGAAVFMSLHRTSTPDVPARPAATEVGRKEAPPEAVKAVARAPAPAATVTAHCDFAPMLSKSGRDDGQERLQARPSGGSAGEVGRLILSGKEAAAAGRVRDAEIAFLNACRSAERVEHAEGTPLADAMYQLGRHYGNVAQSRGSRKPELVQRARLLYTASLQAYRDRYGEKHEKTRFAEQGLAALPGGSAPVQAATRAKQPRIPDAGTVESAKVEKGRKAADSAKVAHDARPGKAIAPAPSSEPTLEPAAPPRSAAVEPSFDCRRARSTPEKIICSDEELARMDRDLGRLHAQAEAAAPDRGAFKRRNDAEWARREATCRDRECLLRWYAQRRDQLAGELSARSE